MLEKEFNLEMTGFSSTGLFLSVEEQLIINVSLHVLKQENQFSSVSFQSKIFCTQGGNYYIAYGKRDDYIRNRMFFYSMDARNWQLLFPPVEEDFKEFRLARNRFTGDPSHMHRFNIGGKRGSIREEKRLSCAVHLLDWETAVGPKGALRVTKSGRVEKNPYFTGVNDPTQMDSYVHHRIPRSSDVALFPTPNLCPAAGDSALEFLEPISADYPPGCWLLRSGSIASKEVFLHNLWWPGHSFRCQPDNGEFYSIYIGSGIRNDDLPFML